jgi:hypothetical protein
MVSFTLLSNDISPRKGNELNFYQFASRITRKFHEALKLPGSAGES